MLYSIVGLILALGILVTIHEYGHFWVARKFGVKVLRFSVGFGKPIWQWQDKQQTEYAIAWIPLGGYVKMLDEREGDVSPEELPYAFSQKKPYQKILIALAGPIANFLFAIAAFSFMHMIGVQELTPVVDQPVADSVAAQAGLQRGDRLLSIDQKAVHSFSDIGLALASRVGETGEIELTVDRMGRRQTLRLPIEDWMASEQSPDPLMSLGILPKLPVQPAVIGQIEAGGAADAAGLIFEDLILSANGVAIDTWMSWVEVIRSHPNQPLAIQVQRADAQFDVTITPGERILEDGSVQGYIGAGTIAQPWPEDQLITTRAWPGKALVKGVQDTWDIVELSYVSIGKMFTGQVSLKQVGGPISMAQMAGRSVQYGFEAFIGFLAFISISLGIVNLLPVPVLDGGHVVIHSIEWLKGGPLSDRAQMIGMQIGLAFILTLMCLAFINDIGRIM